MGRGVPGRRLRHLPHPPVLPDDPARAGRRGAGRRREPWHIFRHIYLPLSRPVLATLAIFTFMWSWNDLLGPLIYLRDLHQYTTTVGLAFFQGQFVGKWPEMMAGALVSLRPMVVLFVLAQRTSCAGIASPASRDEEGGRPAPRGLRPRSPARRVRHRRRSAAVPGRRCPQPSRHDRSPATGRPAAAELAALDAAGVEAIVDLDGGWGEASGAGRALQRTVPGPRRGLRRPRLRAWASDDRFGRRRRPGCATARAPAPAA